MAAMFALRVGADCASRPVVRPVGSPIDDVNPPNCGPVGQQVVRDFGPLVAMLTTKCVS